jgi:hypothetical protein
LTPKSTTPIYQLNLDEFKNNVTYYKLDEVNEEHDLKGDLNQITVPDNSSYWID